jgi:hypothetical protein
MASNHPRINVRIDLIEEQRFKLLKSHGYSAREVLALALNTKDGEKTITVVSKTNGEPVQFPRNILCIRKKN